MIDNPDYLAWKNTKNKDLWIFDKLILSRKLGYICGPAGAPVPKAGNYIVRPITNIYGMSQGASIQYLDKSSTIEPGYFWCEIFKGKHLSVDYFCKSQVLCVQGFNDDIRKLYKWKRWEKTEDQISFPSELNELQYEWINIEYINGKIIEVHLRKNPDFDGHNSDYIIPVWNMENLELKNGEIFVSKNDGNRLGYIYKK
jgi:hypothetical protein